MTLSLRWVGEDEHDRVAETRLRCYAHADKDLESMRDRLRADPRNVGGEFLLAELDGQAVGTAAALPLSMWVRGDRVSCQGVAWVGTIRTHRRTAATAPGGGVATQIMRETLRLARERGQVVSALMPFRASFYEHFGYGLVERRHEWTLPLSVLPSGPFEGIRYYAPDDFEALCAFKQHLTERGQCDIERSPQLWSLYHERAKDGFEVIDRPAATGEVRGWMHLTHSHVNGKDVLRVVENGYADVPALLRQLHFLASLRDQYATAIVTLPSDLPLNLILRETQIPHRPVNHATAEVRPYTRLQLRVLDHKRLIESMRLPQPEHGGPGGSVSVAIQESEGHESRFRIDFADGAARVAPFAGEPDFACRDTTWASITCGDLPAKTAVRLGLARCDRSDATRLLDVFVMGPAPFCFEYF